MIALLLRRKDAKAIDSLLRTYATELGVLLREMVSAAAQNEALEADEIDRITVAMWASIAMCSRRTIEKMTGRAADPFQPPEAIQAIGQRHNFKVPPV